MKFKTPVTAGSDIDTKKAARREAIKIYCKNTKKSAYYDDTVHKYVVGAMYHDATGGSYEKFLEIVRQQEPNICKSAFKAQILDDDNFYLLTANKEKKKNIGSEIFWYDDDNPAPQQKQIDFKENNPKQLDLFDEQQKKQNQHKYWKQTNDEEDQLNWSGPTAGVKMSNDELIRQFEKEKEDIENEKEEKYGADEYTYEGLIFKRNNFVNLF